jgi:tetratricopeptide (TPR) repeat protein
MTRTIILFFLLLSTAGAAWAGSCLQGDCRNGWGKYRWNDGSTFTGSFVNSNPDGEGEYADPAGHKYHVLYLDGAPVTSTPVTVEDEALKRRQIEARRYNEAGLIYLGKKDFESAIFFFNKAITLWPSNPAYHQNYHRAKERKP